MTTTGDIEALNRKWYARLAELGIRAPIGPGNPATPKQVAA